MTKRQNLRSARKNFCFENLLWLPILNINWNFDINDGYIVLKIYASLCFFDLDL